MRASRLLSILMLLQTRGRMSATSLAAELEVSARTILRDVDQLSAAGVPIWADRGRDGGFVLQEGWRSGLTGLTENEANALSLAGLPTVATALGLGNASATAHLKMLATLPDALREDATRVSARLHIDPIDWYRAATPPTYLQAVAHAVWQQRMLLMRYESWQGVKERVVKPLGLVLKAGVWYMVALPNVTKTSKTTKTTKAAKAAKTIKETNEKKEPRTYRLSNIQTLSVIDTMFEYPKTFHLPTFWQATTSRFETSIYTETANLRVTRLGLRRVKELSAVISEAADQSAVIDEESGVTQITVPIESIDHAANQFLGIGAELEVVSPPALRQRIEAAIDLMQAIYRDQVSSSSP